VSQAVFVVNAGEVNVGLAADGRGGAGEFFGVGALLGERSPHDGSMRWSIRRMALA